MYNTTYIYKWAYALGVLGGTRVPHQGPGGLGALHGALFGDFGVRPDFKCPKMGTGSAKGSKNVAFGNIFGYLLHKKRRHWACWLAGRVFILFHDFRDGKTFDPLQPAQSKHSLAFSASPSKPLNFHVIFGSILEILGLEFPSRSVVTKRP